jgi:hypothetical protein
MNTTLFHLALSVPHSYIALKNKNIVNQGSLHLMSNKKEQFISLLKSRVFYVWTVFSGGLLASNAFEPLFPLFVQKTFQKAII